MNELVRANKVTIQVADNGYKAVFHRTHKIVAEVLSENTPWIANTKMNKVAQKEMFRIWIMENADKYEVSYDAVDRREDSNRMPSKYTSETELQVWACNLVTADIQGWTSKMAEDLKVAVTLKGISADEVVPVTVHNGKEVISQYGTGTWAYCTIPVTVTVLHGEVEGYVSMNVALVSGQMKKPVAIGDLGYTFTGFKTEAMKDLETSIKVEQALATEGTTPDGTSVELVDNDNADLGPIIKDGKIIGSSSAAEAIVEEILTSGTDAQ